MKKRRAGGGELPRAKAAGARSPTLKQLARHLGLAPATVSTVMNGTEASGIAPETQARIRAAARELNYRPNFLARCLRTKKSYSVGVLVPQISQGYNVLVMRGIEGYLLQQGYFYFVASHHLREDLALDYAHRFVDRAADGLIMVCGPWKQAMPVPVATVSCRGSVNGATSVQLDHRRAAELALQHLTELGHRKIAFLQGDPAVPDSELRWSAIAGAAVRMGLPISPRLVVPMTEGKPSHTERGYVPVRRLLASGEPFTALFAFNDVSAIGAIRALEDAGLRVPQDVSVLGFDDIETETYLGPGLSTIRQPLEEMGRLAAEAVLARITRPASEWSGKASPIVVQPELVVRATTARASDVAGLKRRLAR
jgi:DNA-binding LacI/PurR family transcriptional regulator